MKGISGETYNISGVNECGNLKLVHVLSETMARYMDKPEDYYKKLITYVKDRAGHDRRYAINCDKIKSELGWRRKYNFEDGLESTVKWFLDNDGWVENVKSGEYRKWIERNYE